MNGGKVAYIGEHTPWPSYIVVTRDKGYPEWRRYDMREECEMRRIPEACYGDIECSACGACLWGFQMDRSGHGVMSRPNYYPWCGRRVVDK